MFKPHRIRSQRLGWVKVKGLRLFRLKLYGSEAGGGGGVVGGQRNYILLFES